MDFTTASSGNKQTTLTQNDLLKAMSLIKPYKEPELPIKKKNIVEKCMNKLGWHRQTTVYLIDKTKITNYLFNPPLFSERSEFKEQQ